MDRKIIGLIVAWAAEDFIEPCIAQGLEYCDEVHVCIAPHSEEMKKFKDSTDEIVDRYRNSVNIVKLDGVKNHSQVKAAILNSMLDMSKIFHVDNWIWTLDVDEFYPHISFENVKLLIEGNICDQIGFEEFYFYINMQHCLVGNHNRLFKIKESNLDRKFRFLPTQYWQGSKCINYIPLRAGGMFHYGMLTNPFAKDAFWRTEYEEKEQSNKVTWLNEIYKNYDLSDENRWIEENERLFGIKSPWFSDSFLPGEDNKLIKFNAIHPWAIRDTGLDKIVDFRRRYGF